MAAEEEKSIEQIQNLKPYLSVKTQEELDAILAYGEEMKAEGERKKQKFWKNHDRKDFKKLLKYKRSNKKEIEGYYKYLNIIKGLERGRFIEEYLYDDILYSGELDEMKLEEKKYSYDDWKEGNVVMEEGVNLCFNGKNLGFQGVKAIAEKIKLLEGVYLDLSWNKIGAEGAEAISKIELKDGVKLVLRGNHIGLEGAKAIAKNLKFKEGVELNLISNKIWPEGAKIIAENMELKEGVELNLGYNEIGDEGAKAIMENMKLKNGVVLKLYGNNISNEMKDKLEKWREERIKKGINCNVYV